MATGRAVITHCHFPAQSSQFTKHPPGLLTTLGSVCVGGQCSFFTDEKTEALVVKGCWGPGASLPGLCSACSRDLSPGLVLSGIIPGRLAKVEAFCLETDP